MGLSEHQCGLNTSSQIQKENDLLRLHVYMTEPLVHHLKIIQQEYYHMYLYYYAFISWCKQALIRHQSLGLFVI